MANIEVGVTWVCGMPRIGDYYFIHSKISPIRSPRSWTATPCDNNDWKGPFFSERQVIPKKYLDGLTYENSPRRMKRLKINGKDFYV